MLCIFKNPDIYNMLSTSMADFIKLYQVRDTVSELSFINRRHMREIENFVSYLEIKFYQPGDIIIKQGSANTNFYFIQDGIVEVIQEKSNFM